jgi:hypothetical protein
MRKVFFTGAALAALLLPSVASAQDPNATGAGVAGGALTGAAVGAIVGGPVGAAVGAGIGAAAGGTVGAASTTGGPVVEERVYVAPEPRARERNCVRDATGTIICEEIRR